MTISLNEQKHYLDGHFISKFDREQRNGHKALAVWFTGLSGSGKSTLVQSVEKSLFQKGFHVKSVDGDQLRDGLCEDLGFSTLDRTENLRRAAELTQILIDSGMIVLAAFITPTNDNRNMIRRLIGNESFLLVHVDCPINICESRDVKGLYAKARSGLISDFTGITSPYEEPLDADLVVHTNLEKLDDCVLKISNLICTHISK